MAGRPGAALETIAAYCDVEGDALDRRSGKGGDGSAEVDVVRGRRCGVDR